MAREMTARERKLMDGTAAEQKLIEGLSIEEVASVKVEAMDALTSWLEDLDGELLAALAAQPTKVLATIRSAAMIVAVER